MFKKMPIPICGVILGLFGLGNLLGNLFGVVLANPAIGGPLRWVCGIIATILLVLFIISVIMNPTKFKNDMGNPIMASVFCTFPMALMLCATYYQPWLKGVSTAIWYIALILHIVLIIYFTVKFIFKLEMPKVFASYFIVYVGIAMAAMTAPAFKAEGIGAATFWFGLVTLIILLILVTVRYVKYPDAPNPAKPLICIYTAPTSLCIAGYIQSVMPKNLALLKVLWIVATILFVFATIKFLQYLKLPFLPSYAAYTFPFVISAIATMQLMACSKNMGAPMPWLRPILFIEAIIATITTVYALVRYLGFLFAPAKEA